MFAVFNDDSVADSIFRIYPMIIMYDGVKINKLWKIPFQSITKGGIRDEEEILVGGGVVHLYPVFCVS
jgi:hypothetical protein